MKLHSEIDTPIDWREIQRDILRAGQPAGQRAHVLSGEAKPERERPQEPPASTSIGPCVQFSHDNRVLLRRPSHGSKRPHHPAVRRCRAPQPGGGLAARRAMALDASCSSVRPSTPRMLADEMPSTRLLLPGMGKDPWFVENASKTTSRFGSSRSGATARRVAARAGSAGDPR